MLFASDKIERLPHCCFDENKWQNCLIRLIYCD